MTIWEDRAQVRQLSRHPSRTTVIANQTSSIRLPGSHDLGSCEWGGTPQIATTRPLLLPDTIHFG
jgi:hypothetical protein